eukprot:gene3698-4046_t
MAAVHQEILVFKISIGVCLGVICFMLGWFMALPSAQGFFNLHHAHCPPADPSPLPVEVASAPHPDEPSDIIGRSLSGLSVAVLVKEEEEAGSVVVGKGKGFRMERERTVQPFVLEEVFGMLHHPASPLNSELLFYHTPPPPPPPVLPSDNIDPPPSDSVENDGKLFHREHCQEVVLSRTGSLAYMPNKCLAMALVEPSHADSTALLSRRGRISGLQDQFSADFASKLALLEEKKLLPPFLSHLDALTNQLRALVGDPPDNLVVIMVLNSGVLDLFTNFLCSCREANIFSVMQRSLVVFTVEQEVDDVVRAMSIRVFRSPHLANLPKQAAGAYGDGVFGMAMWLKNSAVFLAVHAGYHVLFQDVDLVWMTNPIGSLLQQPHDLVFMDDGARTPRFSPYYFNSGFYLVRSNARTHFLLHRMLLHLIEIIRTHSHQSTLTKTLVEVSALTPISWLILDQEEYPSGYAFHHNLGFIQEMKAGEKHPKVFHMCWTESRKQKVTYFQQLGLWLLPEEGSGGGEKGEHCLTAQGMLDLRRQQPQAKLLDYCCRSGEYFNKPR